MGGGLMQLVAYGAQDVYLTGNPQITFWKVTYRRHTNFAMESIEQTFNGQADFGRRVQCTVSRNGDLAYRTYLQVVLPQINACPASSNQGSDRDAAFARWIDNPGIRLIDYVEVEIGGQRIDRQYGQFMHLWNQLTMTAEQERGYNKMIGQTTQLTYLTDPDFSTVNTPCDTGAPCNTCVPRCSLPETTLYVPLQFWFCRNPGLALPLIALQYHEVKINIEMNGLDCVLWAVDSITGEQSTAGTSNKSTQGAYTKSLVAASLYVDYVFLDTDERRRMAQNPHEYLIEQLQYTGAESVGSSSNKIKLNFNHPCKELIFVVQKDYLVDCCKQYETGEQLFKALGVQPFNFTDCIDALPNAYHAFAGPGTAGSGDFVVSGLFVDPGAGTVASGSFDPWGVGGYGNTSGSYVDGWAPTSGAPLGTGQDGESLVSDAGAFVLAETALNMHCWGENPVTVAKLQLNGQDRFSEREGTYFDLVQPYQHHTRSPDTGINVYSFALRPEEHQPSGTCNMSRIDNATLQLVLSNDTVGGDQTAKVYVYATNYNVLRVMSGMGGLAYSN